MRSGLLFLRVFIIFWIIGAYFLFIHYPLKGSRTDQVDKTSKLKEQLDSLESSIVKQSKYYKSLLKNLQIIDKAKASEESDRVRVLEEEKLRNEENDHDPKLVEGPILPVLLIACNREAAVRRSLDLLLKYRPSKDRFPIIVSQDCGHAPTAAVIKSYGNQVTHIQQPDLSLIPVPVKEKKFRGYFLISRHYKWALNQIFNFLNHEAVIIVEDDLDISSDFFEYFSATLPILKEDSTLWCVSAWNDNGKKGLIDIENGASVVHRTDFFPGLGWMLTRETWGELEPNWPKSYWDDWMRAKEQRQGRACLRPEISRTRTFGKKGVSNGLFFEKHLKFIHLNSEHVLFSQLDLSYLGKVAYDNSFERDVQRSEVISVEEAKSGSLPQDHSYRIIYYNKETFKRAAKSLGLMDDFKAGVPRTGYQGVVSFWYQGRHIYLSPNNAWKGYDPTWS